MENNKLTDTLNRTASTMEAMPYLKLEEMDVMDQLYFMGAFIKFANDMEPLIEKYVPSEEKLNELKEKKVKDNTNKFLNIISFFQGKKEDKNADHDTPSRDD